MFFIKIFRKNSTVKMSIKYIKLANILNSTDHSSKKGELILKNLQNIFLR